MPTCKNCGETSPNAFYETQRSAYCRPCHKSRYFGPGRLRNLQTKLARGKCADCGLVVTPTNSVAFDWDHLRDKTKNITEMVLTPDATFHAEVAKCELRCSNCHRIATASRPRTHPTPGRPRKVTGGTQPTPETTTSPTETLPDATQQHLDTHP